MLDGRDDVEALSRVLAGLSEELRQQHEQINEVCQVADQVGGIEPLNVGQLQVLLDQELELASGSIVALGTAEKELEKIMKMLREFSRVEAVRLLSMQKECSDEALELMEKADKKYMELVKFQKECTELDRKLGRLAASLS